VLSPNGAYKSTPLLVLSFATLLRKVAKLSTSSEHAKCGQVREEQADRKSLLSEAEPMPRMAFATQKPAGYKLPERSPAVNKSYAFVQAHAPSACSCSCSCSASLSKKLSRREQAEQLLRKVSPTVTPKGLHSPEGAQSMAAPQPRPLKDKERVHYEFFGRAHGLVYKY
jgi:hypothetical protein